ncbi:MAG: PilZ domain-containing protein [Acidobacteriota bacterium]|nr:PilZ domain-containing protein [Acidobacteriota bacterium]
MAISAQRRSERVLIDMPIVVRGESGARPFQEETFTVTISAHGALLMLEADVTLGQKLTVMNPKTTDQQEARVAYKGAIHAGLAQVAVEFAKPSPEFWQMDSPPANWTAEKRAN